MEPTDGIIIEILDVFLVPVFYFFRVMVDYNTRN